MLLSITNVDFVGNLMQEYRDTKYGNCNMVSILECSFRAEDTDLKHAEIVEELFVQIIL